MRAAYDLNSDQSDRKRNSEKANVEYRIMNIECRRNVFCLFYKKMERSDSGAADKAAFQWVKVPPYQLPGSGMKRCHSSCRVTTRSLRGVNGPAALWAKPTAVGATGGPSKHGSLNITE